MLKMGLRNFVNRHYYEHWESSGEGGYPPDVGFLPGHVVVALLDPAKDYNAPLLEVLSNKEVRDWHKGTKYWFKERGLGWDEASGEAI